ECDAGGMILRRDRDLAHPSADGAGGVAHGSAEQFGQCADVHVSPSEGIAIGSSITVLLMDMSVRSSYGAPSQEHVKRSRAVEERDEVFRHARDRGVGANAEPAPPIGANVAHDTDGQ